MFRAEKIVNWRRVLCKTKPLRAIMKAIKCNFSWTENAVKLPSIAQAISRWPSRRQLRKKKKNSLIGARYEFEKQITTRKIKSLIGIWFNYWKDSRMGGFLFLNCHSITFQFASQLFDLNSKNYSKIALN